MKRFSLQWLFLLVYAPENPVVKQFQVTRPLAERPALKGLPQDATQAAGP